MAWVAFFDLFINLPNKLQMPHKINANSIRVSNNKIIVGPPSLGPAFNNKLYITFLYVLSSSPKKSNYRILNIGIKERA